jgi:PilZ domain-containing protein
MKGLEAVIAQVLEAGRLKQRLLADEARQISRVAGCLLAAARVPRTIHVCGEGQLWTLADLIARRFRGEGEGLLAPARAFPRDIDARQLLAYVNHDEALLVMSANPASRLGPLLRQAQGQGVQTMALLTRDTAPLAAYCEAAIVVPSEDIRIVSEVFLSLGHILVGLVAQGLNATHRLQSDPSHDRPVVDPDSLEIDSLRLRPDSEEGELLAKAVSAGYAPPTDPTGRSRRPIPPTDAEVVVPGQEEKFRFRCGSCEAVVGVDRRHCGKRGQCPHCKAEFRIPQADFDATATQRAQAIERPQETAAPKTTSTKRSPRRTTKRRRERRRAPRINVTDALVRLGLEGYPELAVQGYPLDDLSLTGLRFLSERPNHEIGQIVHLTVDFPAFPLPVRIKGEIRRVIPLEEKGAFGTGVRFLEYVGDAQRQIRRLLDGDKLRGVRRR